MKVKVKGENNVCLKNRKLHIWLWCANSETIFAGFVRPYLWLYNILTNEDCTIILPFRLSCALHLRILQCRRLV